MYVQKYCYLGCVIDEDLTLSQEYKAVYRRVERKIYDKMFKMWT